MKRVIFSRGVPDELRSDNAPELMEAIVRQVCQYLDISQIVTGGHNPRGNAICERVNQTLGAMIRKLSDLDYKCRESHELTDQSQRVIESDIDQRLVVLTRSVRNQ
jgi:hypothetical protein